jgi:hypothetical protein
MIMRSSAPNETFIRLFDDVATNGHADVPPVFGPCGTIPTGLQVVNGVSAVTIDVYELTSSNSRCSG